VRQIHNLKKTIKSNKCGKILTPLNIKGEAHLKLN